MEERERSNLSKVPKRQNKTEKKVIICSNISLGEQHILVGFRFAHRLIGRAEQSLGRSSLTKKRREVRATINANPVTVFSTAMEIGRIGAYETR